MKETPNGYNGNTVPPRGDPSKGDPVVANNLMKGWEISEEDLVQYKDMQRRGLQFLFSAIRKQENTVIYSPMNKVVSVYQKPDEGDENAGDFVLVSMSGNNPNDVRVMDITNEYVGDVDRDPMYLIQKAIEMADDTGMSRDIAEYGEFGKTESMIELAGGVSEFGNINDVMNNSIDKVNSNISGAKSDSIVTTHADAVSKGNPEVKDTLLKKFGRVGLYFSSQIKTGRTTEAGVGMFKGMYNAGKTRLAKQPKADQFDLATHKHNLAMERDKPKLATTLEVAKLRQDKDLMLDPYHAGQKVASHQIISDLLQGRNKDVTAQGLQNTFSRTTDVNYKPVQKTMDVTGLKSYKAPESKIVGVVKPVAPSNRQEAVRAHLAGGGLGEYNPKVLPAGTSGVKKTPKPGMNMGPFPKAPKSYKQPTIKKQ